MRKGKTTWAEGVPLSRFERLVLMRFVHQDPERAVLERQLGSARVTSREYTGAGLYTILSIDPSAPRLARDVRTLDSINAAHLTHPDTPGGASVVVWIADGRLETLEFFTFQEDWPEGEDAFRFTANIAPHVNVILDLRKHHDGTLLELLVLDANLADWQKVLDFVRKRYSPAFEVDGVATALPGQVDEIFSIRRRAAPWLHFDIGGVVAACYFFTPDEIEFDVQPKDGQSDAVRAFMAALANEVGKPVVLTPEGMPEMVMLRVDASSGGEQ